MRGRGLRVGSAAVVALIAAGAVGAAPKSVPVIPAGHAYRVTTLASDLPGFSPLQEPLLVNPWGIARGPSSPFWLALDGTSTTLPLTGDFGAASLVPASTGYVNLPG